MKRVRPSKINLSQIVMSLFSLRLVSKFQKCCSAKNPLLSGTSAEGQFHAALETTEYSGAELLRSLSTELLRSLSTEL
jgi:hypothetical protein